MALTYYSDLISAAEGWLDDTNINARVVDSVALYEAAVNRRFAERPQQTTTTLTPSSGQATLPTDYLNWKRVTWSSTPKRELEYVDPSYLVQSYPSAPSDTPRFFTVEGETLKIMPTSTAATIDFLYSQKVPSLAAATSSANWLLTAHPDFYLSGTLAAVETYRAGGGERTTRFAEMAALVDGQKALLERLRFSQGGPAMVRPYGSAP
jgi:hypothetical protein